MSIAQNFDVFSGNDVTLTVTVTDRATGNPLDLTGAQALIYSLGKSATAGSAIITKTLSAGVQLLDAEEGQLEISLTAADLEPLNGTYYHELRLTNALGKKATLLHGTVTVSPNLIRN
jgi:hypothetical protein